MSTVTDAVAKDTLRNWPIIASRLFRSGVWLRLLPFPVKGESGLPTLPYLYRVGDSSKTIPDGLYARFGEQCVDIIAIEHCSSLQNLSDKRSRYAIGKAVSFLALPEDWHSGWLVLVRGGQGGKYRRMRDLIYKHGFKGEQWSGWRIGSRKAKDWKIPIRTIGVIYALDHKPGHLMDKHEIILKHSQLSQITQQQLRQTLRSMSQ